LTQSLKAEKGKYPDKNTAQKRAPANKKRGTAPEANNIIERRG
jgi:hypothetical protein